MKDHTKIDVTRRIALMTVMGAALLGCAGNPRNIGAVFGGSALAGAIGSVFRQKYINEQHRQDKAQNVRAAAPARRPAFG